MEEIVHNYIQVDRHVVSVSFFQLNITKSHVWNDH